MGRSVGAPVYFGFFLSLLTGILLVVLSVNGRLQNVIAAAFGQQAPGATPTGDTSGAGGAMPPPAR